MKRNKRTLKEELSLIFRGIKEFDSILPGQIFLVLCCSVVLSFTPYVSIFMSAQIINELVDIRNPNILALYVVITIGLTLLLNSIAARLQTKISIGFDQLFSSHEIRLNQKAYYLPFEKLEDSRIQALRDQVSGSIGTTGGGMASLYWGVESISKNLCTVFISLVLCINIFFGTTYNGSESLFLVVNSPYITFAILALVIMSSVVSSKMTSKLFDVSFDVFKNGATYNRYGNFYMLNYLSNEKSAKDIRMFSQQNLIIEETQKRCYRPFCDGDRREKSASNKYDGIKLLISAFSGGFVYLFIGLKALSGTVSIGNVVMSYAVVTMLIYALSEFSMMFTDLRNNNEHLKLYFEYIDLPEQKDIGTKLLNINTNLGFRFENVSFMYPNTTNYVLRNVSLSIMKGKRYAIVGENGSGKTTLVKLLCRLYEPTDGHILLDSCSVSNYKYDEYIKLFSVVFQDFGLLSFMLAQNIAASVNYVPEHVEESLYKSGFGAKLDSLPKGITQALFHDFEEDGINLSGGEEQKIAIARSYYKEAPVIILDEPTAALDPRAEYEIYAQFNKITEKKTTLIISHRLSSCRFCDEIIVMDKGEIIQRGKHDDLVEKTGKYQELWNAQAQHYID